jgi:hypothetical protein
MTRIDLPSGGSINIQFEADDYAYVQNLPAMQMMKVLGTDPGQFNAQETNALYDGPTPFFKNPQQNLETTFSPHNTIEVQLPVPVHNATELNNRYLKGMTQMYFNFLIDITGNNDYEYISGFAPILSFNISGTATNGTYSQAAITLNCDPIDAISTVTLTDYMNPISKIAWDWSKRNLSKKIFAGSDFIGTQGYTVHSLQNIVSSLEGLGQQVLNTLEGFNREMRGAGRSRVFNPAKSFIRLYAPTGFKKGGGVRVKQITINDSWGDMTNSGTGNDFDYGQSYNYTTIDPVSQTTISSGVAEYEPMLGNDENPWHQPVVYTHQSLLGPSDKYIVETPFGESHFPAPNVGYSRVTVRNLARTNVTRTATGKVVHNFYTAKDFPVITDNTDISDVSNWSKFLGGILSFDSKDYTTASQGYKIELNDMHGKPSAEIVYSQAGDTISSIEYYYN